ncbi:MAG: hypothetical protein Kow0098_00760 [Ignavibacteriaceae bacterium]
MSVPVKYNLLQNLNKINLRAIPVIMFLSVFSCSDINITEVSGYESEFFPTKVGNKWIYDNQGVEWNIETTGKTIIKGLSYYIFVSTYENIPDTNYYRISNDGKVIINIDGEDYTFIDFNAPIGEEWQMYYDFYGIVRQLDLQTTVPAGTFSGVTEIFIDNTKFSDVYEFNKYAPGVGLIESVGFRRFSYLQSAVVNGIVYPQ